MFDVVVIGGSFAGLTAALQLGRASQSVAVIDSGLPRNRLSPAAHGVPGWDGKPPADILSRFKSDVSGYDTVSLHIDTVISAARDGSNFRIGLASGNHVTAKRVLLAHGVVDILPDIPGTQEVWGRTLLHCPYCHGFEVRNQPIGVLAVHPMSAHQAQLLVADWSADVTLLTGTGAEFDVAHGIPIDDRPIQALRETEGGLSVVFGDGTFRVFASVFTAPRVSLVGTPAEMLGCAMADGPPGPFIQVGPMGQTSEPGVFAAGDCAAPGHSVTLALGQGAAAGVGCHQSLVFPEMIQPLEVPHSA